MRDQLDRIARRQALARLAWVLKRKDEPRRALHYVYRDRTYGPVQRFGAWTRDID